MSWQKTSVVIGSVAGILAIGSGVFQIDKYYAHAEEVRGLAKKIEYTNKRIERKIKEDQLYNTRTRKWKIEDRIEAKGKDLILSRELKELQHLEDLLQSELKIEGVTE